MNVVLDANVVVSAVATSGTCLQVYRECLKAHALVRSVELVEEIRKTLATRLKLPAPVLAEFIVEFETATRLVRPAQVTRDACRDPRDLHVLGLAKASRAELLVTGDLDLLGLRTFGAARIVRPAEALRELTGSPPAPRPYPPASSGGLTAAERRRRYGRRRRGSRTPRR